MSARHDGPRKSSGTAATSIGWLRHSWICPEYGFGYGWICPACGRGVRPGQNTCDHGAAPAEVIEFVEVKDDVARNS